MDGQVGDYVDGEELDGNFGHSIAMSSDGSRIAIGAPTHHSGRGHVRVYDWNESSWTQVGGDIDGEAEGDRSGYSVAMSSDGSKIAIGARRNSR